ncbi:MAG: sugar transferase [Hyphomonadaceae bacterium]|nr:sugar transferase [Hyphomonadaceae bacterium]
MSKTALRRPSADNAARGAPRGRSRAALSLAERPNDTEVREAAWLQRTAAAFGLYGLNLEPPRESDRLVVSKPIIRKFPSTTRRGAHVPRRVAALVLPVLDWGLVFAAADLAARWGAGGSLLELPLALAAVFFACALALKAGLWLTESYVPKFAHFRPERSIGGLALGAIAGLTLSMLLAPDAQSAGALSAVLPFAALVMAGVHAATMLWLSAAHRQGVFSETCIVIGATEAAQRFVERAQRSGAVRVLALADDRVGRAPASVNGIPVAGSVRAMLDWDGLPVADRIVVALPAHATKRTRAVIETLKQTPHRIDLLLDFETEHMQGLGADTLNGVAVACVSGRPRCLRRALLQRIVDLALGSILLAAFALPMLAIATAIRLDKPGPVLFRQRRLGFNNRTFTLLKFRSLEIGGGGPTRIGAFLRRFGLDELPQLLNVIAGDMSLVGPRPHAAGMQTGARKPEAVVAAYAHRHRVKPGITGWAQVNGARGGVKTPAALRRRVKLDLDYIARASLWLDLQIMARTPMIMWRDGKRR